MIRYILISAAFGLLSTGCGGETSSADGTSGPSNATIAATILPEPNPNIDILFVIDNSHSMLEEQNALANWAQTYLFGVIETEAGFLPNLHIGVISSDMGTGDYASGGCEGSGDRGILHNQPQLPGCAGPSDRYIRDVANPDGSRDRNYSGELADAFACISNLGTEGCGFEQPLEAMRLALSGDVTENAGFLRDDALLAVIFITDEDDCSTIDPQLFDPSQAAVAELGPLASFRCFEFGVTCAASDPRAPGERTDCVAASSDFMNGIEPYVDVLRGLKADPSMVVVGAIAGPPEPVEVWANPEDGRPELAPSCVAAGGGVATPAVRLADFLGGFPARNQFASICEGDLVGPLQSVASVIGGTAAASPCLRGALADRDGDSPGVQPECSVFAVSD
ncbi:MAG: hypothetical protein AAGC55_31385, partial [Myxococcota bacterium]